MKSGSKLKNTKTVTWPTETVHERAADSVVHALGLTASTVACIVLMVGAVQVEPALVWACAIYSAGMMASFMASAGYHLLPLHHIRQTLRRLDHTAIYALIAGTFTPLLVHIASAWALWVLVAIWGLAIPAMLYKLLGSNIEPRWSLASYLGLGWLGVLAIPEFGSHLPTLSVACIIIGGLVYTAGTYFYARKEQAYRAAIWHGFVLVGTAFLFLAVWTVVFSSSGMAAIAP